MRIVKMTFDPATLKHDDEAWPAFNAGGMTLKFWALYKSAFCTDQHFREALERLAEYFEKAFDLDHPDIKPYTNIDEFMVVLNQCGPFSSRMFGNDTRAWALKNWDHFNLAVQRKVVLEYEVVEPVTKQMVIDQPKMSEATA